jgi:large subunit ribosomal protein L18
LRFSASIVSSISILFETIRKEEIAEELVKFNLWFSYHILVQDDIIDQKTSSKDFYKNVIYSDSFLFKALLKLNELMTKMTPDFRKNVMKTYEDYIDCILWEKEHMKSMNIYSETDIRNFGKKFSPLKINNLIFTYLSSQNPNFNYLESLNSFLENFHICMQIIDDVNGVTLCSASSMQKDFDGDGGNKDGARKVGKLVAEAAKAKGISQVVFDRGGYIYHGRVQELAEGAREGGLKF